MSKSLIIDNEPFIGNKLGFKEFGIMKEDKKRQKLSLSPRYKLGFIN
jgi:hypothetical protein